MCESSFILSSLVHRYSAIVTRKFECKLTVRCLILEKPNLFSHSFPPEAQHESNCDQYIVSTYSTTTSLPKTAE